MHELGRERRMDDDRSDRPEIGDEHTEQAPVIRPLANPRRARRV